MRSDRPFSMGEAIALRSDSQHGSSEEELVKKTGVSACDPKEFAENVG